MEVDHKSEDDLTAEAFETLKIRDAERTTPKPTVDNATAMALLEQQIGNLRFPGGADPESASDVG
jgi:hypothetical protein